MTRLDQSYTNAHFFHCLFSYVAVCGLPDPKKDHAIVMAKFSRECVDKFNEVVRSLEMKLGPDTGELAVRYVFLNLLRVRKQLIFIVRF